jgi:hypothetical protein
MPIKQNPFWYKLLKLMKKEGIIENGLTIPFIFGAYKIINRPFHNIQELLDEIHNTPIDKYPVLQKCFEIHQDVVVVEEKWQYNAKNIKEIKIKSLNSNNYLVISTNTNIGNTVEKISSSLTSLYGKAIENETFSWSNNKKEWIAFNDKEIELIKSIA